jgi:hypothetical protein
MLLCREMTLRANSRHAFNQRGLSTPALGEFHDSGRNGSGVAGKQCDIYRFGPAIRASIRRVAGCATSTGSADHATAGATANSKLTFHLDHSVGADD